MKALFMSSLFCGIFHVDIFGVKILSLHGLNLGQSCLDDLPIGIQVGPGSESYHESWKNIFLGQTESSVIVRFKVFYQAS